MRDRIVPCAECRKSRRKCVQTESWRCVRCEHYDKQCKPEIISDGEEEDIVDDLQTQVRELEAAVNNMELQLRTSCRRNTNPLHNIINKWKVQLKNGTFRIDTGIQSISDLIDFQTNKLVYLSPYAENQTMIRFVSESNSQLFIPFTLRLLVKGTQKTLKTTVDTLDLPEHWNIDAINMTINQLVEIYFKCHHAFTPLLHKASFMETFKQLEHPEDDLLTLSLCANVCTSPCDHIPCLPSERRILADYFYIKAKSIFLDQFDLAEKRLENVMSINLLAKYMQMTLKYKELRKLIGLAYQICIDLYYDDTERDELQQMLYSRHITMTAFLNRFINYISNSASYDIFFCLPEWKSLPDEPEEIQKLVVAHNWLLRLYNHPFVESFMRSMSMIQLGHNYTLSLESLIRIEEVITGWSKSGPDGFCLCADINNLEMCLEAIDNSTDCILLMTFVHYQAFIVSVYSSLLNPITLRDNDQLLSFVQQSALEKSLRAGYILIHAVSRISTVAEDTSECYYKLAACDFMFHSINVLLLLSLSSNTRVSKESRVSLKACLEDVVKQKFMQEQCLPKIGKITDRIDFDDESSFNLEKYDGYALPWFAMIYDVSYHIALLE